ncbi:MAG: hypothetical protein ILA26_01290 [Methanobrevibacter sp.]|uniref:hypothetical protein n=1 Tax=Methanobrevibacter sp. TaxID=66852 RepID=UPI001B3DD1A8|nr:hypothetical protein [Methanobrevibacter sp.]MBP3790644.1 hypothetical protein [Methanobrevibacter sp.]
MNKEDFISELVKQTGLTNEQGAAANDIFENTFLAGNKNKDLIVSQLTEKLGIDESKADMIYTAAIGILSSGVLDKVTSIFK